MKHAKRQRPAVDKVDHDVASFLDLPGLIDSVVARKWLQILRAHWIAQLGRPPGLLSDDLAALDTWFDPTRPGSRLRAAVATLSSASRRDTLDSDEVPALFRLDVGSDRRLVTPEGRVALHVLDQTLSTVHDARLLVVSQEAIAQGVASLLSHYRDQSQRRLLEVVRLLDGTAKSALRPAAAGLLFFLLVNRNTAPERPLRKHQDDPRTARLLTRMISESVAEFAAPFRRSSDGADRAIEVYRGWAYGEIARRLGRGFVTDAKVAYIVDPVLAEQRLARHLAARTPAQRAEIPSALHAAVEAYERNRAALSALGESHERPGVTTRLVHALSEAALGVSD
jgi:hypothetical protein